MRKCLELMLETNPLQDSEIMTYTAIKGLTFNVNNYKNQ